MHIKSYVRTVSGTPATASHQVYLGGTGVSLPPLGILSLLSQLRGAELHSNVT